MRTVAVRHGICFNIRLHTFPDLAQAIGLERLAKSRRIPLPPLADFLLARKAIAAKVADGGYFAPVRDFPNMPHVILSSVGDLKRAGVAAEALDRFAQSRRSSKLAELAAIYDEIERLQAEAGYFDVSENLAAAAEAAPTSHLLRGTLAVCLYGFRELNRGEQEFFRACLAAAGTGHAFVPEDVAGRTEPLAKWLEAEGFARQGVGPAENAAQQPSRALPLPRDVSIVSAPGIASEVQEMARYILAYAARPRASLSDVGVLLRHPAAYERTVRDVFDSADIPYVFLDGTPLADTLAGRLLQLLVRIRLGGYPRAEVMEFLSLAPLRPYLLKAFPEASPADWERCSREAGIVRGRDHWRRVREMRRRLEWRIGRLRKESPGEPDSPDIALLDRDRQSLLVFERVINTLLKRLSAIPDRGPVGILMGGLLRALLTLARLPEEERVAVHTIATLARENVADEEVPFEAFASLIEELLAQRLPPADVYRSGRVTVSSLSGAVGLPFKLVLIPGLVERSFPPPAAQDPVVLDREREALNAACGTALPTREVQAADEQFAFWHAVNAAHEALVLSHPRLDAATGQVRVPSHFLLRAAESLIGQHADYEALKVLTKRVPLGRVEPERGPLTPAEWDLAQTARAVTTGQAAGLSGLPGFAAIARGTHAEASRWGQFRFTEYDGLLGLRLPLPATMAATHLETYGTCPFKFFGERILGVREMDEPEEVETISPLDRGSIIHDILEQFLSGLVKDGLVPLREASAGEYRRRLQETAREVFREFEASGAVGYPFMWRVEQERILTDLEGFLVEELADDSGYVPAYFEARFGPAASWTRMSPGSSPQPLELKAGKHALQFTGFIDRIDVHPSGVARVIDYKSGRVYGEKDNRLRGGQSLQLPLYVQAADAMLAHNGIKAQTREAHYYYVTGRGGFRRVQFTRDALKERGADFRAILETVADGIIQGIFPQNPGDDGKNCDWCPFQPVCGHWRARLVERKLDDKAITKLVAMWEIE